MGRAILLKLIVICIGIQLSVEESVSNNCGRLYYDEPAVSGRNVTLKFEPVQADSDLPCIWNTKATPWTVLWSEVSEERNYHLDNFSLVINTTTDDQGRRFYTDYGSCSSEVITLKLKERPNIPELLNTQSIEDCHNCIVGNVNDSLTIRCNVTGGTAPLHVNITVGGKSTDVFSTNEGVYVANIQLTTTRHMANVTCSVSNIALDSPLISEAKLYILVKPQSVRVSLVANYTAILPYYTYNVTCTVRRAYPACSVTWVWPAGVDKLDSTEVLDGTNVITTEAELSLNVSRKVNGKEVTCKAVCADVDFNQAYVHVIFVPYERTISFNVSSSINIMESTTTTIECKASWASTVMWLDSENHTTLLVVDCGTGAACLRLESVSEIHGGNYTCLADDTRMNVSKQLTVTVEGLSDHNSSAKTDGKNSSMIIVIIITCIVSLLAAVVLVVVFKRRNSKKSEMMQNRGAALGADNREVDVRNEEIHEYEEMHEYEGLADRGPSYAYEGLADRGSSHVYEGLADRGPSHAYEGLADRGPSHVYEGLSDRDSSHAYEGLAERDSSHAYEGLADRGPSHAYEGLAARGSSHSYEGLADRGSSHAYEGLAERGPSYAYKSINTESKTETTTHEERVYMN